MRLSKFLQWFALSGAVVPMVLELMWWLINKSSSWSLNAKICLQKITLVLWPTSYGMLAATSDRVLAIKLFLLTTLGNVVLYTVLGMLLWYGLAKQRVFLVVPIALLSVIWWWLLSLH